MSQIQVAIWVLTCLAHWSRVVAILSESIVLGLEELERMRESIKKNQGPLSWADFVSKFQGDVAWGDSLKQLQIEQFHLGKLVAKAPNGFEWSKWLIFKDQLGEQLKKEFGIDFKVKIRRPE